MIKGVIFDFDGLIVDTESIWFEAYKETLFEKHQVEVTLEGFSKCIGTGNDVLYKYLNDLVGTPVAQEQIEEYAHNKYHEKMLHPSLRDGVREYLEEAKAIHLKIGLASSSSQKWVTGYLEQLGIIDYFEVINTRDVVEKVKPDPELYLKTLKDLDLNPTETIAFEDSLNGLIAAKQAGIHCVIVPNDVTRMLPFENHDYHIPSMGSEKLHSVIENLLKK